MVKRSLGGTVACTFVELVGHKARTLASTMHCAVEDTNAIQTNRWPVAWSITGRLSRNAFTAGASLGV